MDTTAPELAEYQTEVRVSDALIQQEGPHATLTIVQELLAELPEETRELPLVFALDGVFYPVETIDVLHHTLQGTEPGQTREFVVLRLE